MSAEIIKTLGYEWVRPCGFWQCGEKPYAGAVAVESSEGWIVLTKFGEVVHGPKLGSISYQVVKYKDLKIMELDLYSGVATELVDDFGKKMKELPGEE